MTDDDHDAILEGYLFQFYDRMGRTHESKRANVVREMVRMVNALNATRATGLQRRRGSRMNDAEVDVDGYVDESRSITYYGKAKRQPNGKYACLAEVGGKFCRVEVTISVNLASTIED